MKPYKAFRNQALHEAVPGKPPTMAQRIQEAPKSSGDKAAAKEAITDWKDKMEAVQEKITWLQKVRLKNMENNLKQAEAKFAAGDYDWVIRNLYWIGDLT